MSYYDITSCVLTEIIGDFGYKQFANEGGIKPFFGRIIWLCWSYLFFN